MWFLISSEFTSQVLLVVKKLPANAGDPSSIAGSGRFPGVGNGNLLQYFCLENSMKRTLTDYSPWSLKELDTTEHTHTHTVNSLYNTTVSTNFRTFSLSAPKTQTH